MSFHDHLASPVVPFAPVLGSRFLGSRFPCKVTTRMPSSTLIPFLVGLGSLRNPFKQKSAPFFILGYWAT